METWERIRDEITGMLADGKPLEDVIGKLEQRKNEMAKANLIEVMDEMKNPKPMTNEEWLHTLNTEQLAEWLTFKRKLIRIPETNYEAWLRWLKEKHDG